MSVMGLFEQVRVADNSRTISYLEKILWIPWFQLGSVLVTPWFSHATPKAGAGSQSMDMRSIALERKRSEYLMTAACSARKKFPCTICYCDILYLINKLKPP